MALGKRKRRQQSGEKTKMDGGRDLATRGWLESAFRMGASRPVHLLTKHLQPTDAGGLLLPKMMISTGILPLMLRKDEIEAMGGFSGLKVRVFDAAGLEHAMYLETINNNNSSCQLVGPQYRDFINENLIQHGARRRNNIIVSVWAFRANSPGWRHRSPEEDPLWFARDLCLAITADTDAVGGQDEDDAFDVAARAPPMDSWRGVSPNILRSSSRRKKTCTAAPRSALSTTTSATGCIAGASGERHWVLDSGHGRGPLVLRFIRVANPII